MGKRALMKLKQQQKASQLILAVLGFILFAAGAFSFFVLRNQDQAATHSSSSGSTIPAEVSLPAPSLSLQNINGRTESLLDYRDQVVLVNNWATWCPPCKAEMPTLVSYYQDHLAEGFVIISIEAGESQQQVQEFATQYKMTFPIWLDPGGVAMDAFKNQNLPSSYVIDRSGVIRVMWVGEINRAMLEKYVTPLLAKN